MYVSVPNIVRTTLEVQDWNTLNSIDSLNQILYFIYHLSCKIYRKARSKIF